MSLDTDGWEGAGAELSNESKSTAGAEAGGGAGAGGKEGGGGREELTVAGAGGACDMCWLLLLPSSLLPSP